MARKRAKDSAPRTKKAKKQRREHPILRFIFGTIFTITAIIGICGGVACSYVYNYAVDYIANEENKMDLEVYKANQAQTSIIYGYNEKKELVELLRLHGAENRMWIDYDDIPDTMIDAFRDLEDKRFHEHQGVDWTRTILGVVKSGFEQGGSTITQQLIKNLTGENGRTVSRKFFEILNALNLEQNYSKKTIMEFYLNTAYLGNGCYGVKTAAEYYFGKDVKDLNAAECATISSITQAPGALDPIANFDANHERQQYALRCMFEQGSLTQAEYDEARNFELVFTEGKTMEKPKDELDEDKEYSDEEIEEIEKAKEEIESSYYVDFVIDNVIEDLMLEYDLTYNEAWKKVFFGGLRIYSAVDMEVQEIAENVYENRIAFPSEEDTEENPAVQSAITIMDYNGRVVAMVGGAGEKGPFRGLNRASQSPRQPGSSIKPISVYAPAIDQDIITWSTKVQNYGIKMGSSRWPSNYGGNKGAPNSFVTVQYALQVSLNTVPAQIASKMGLENCFSFLVDDLRFTTFVEDKDSKYYDANYSTIAVGGCSEGVTTLEMAAAFQIFGNNGYYFRPHAYYKVTNNDGTEVLLKSGDDSGDQVISESSAGVMRNLLKTVTRGGGTGAAYGVNGFETFAKTGTTSDDKDRWFVAGTPYYVAAVWYGYDQPRRIWNVSGNPAGRIYKEIMDEVHKDLDDLEFPNANGVVARSYCTISGDIASGGCPRATGYYKSSNVPNRCKGCSIINGIGQGIPSVIPNTKATTKTTTDKDDDKTTKPTQGGNITKPTLPKPSQVIPAPTTAPTTQQTTAPTQAPEPVDPPVDVPIEPDPPIEGGGDSGNSGGDSGGDSDGGGSIEEQVERMIRHSRQKH